MINHKLHAHPNTPQARAVCRAALEPIPTGSLVEVRHVGEDGKTRSWSVRVTGQSPKEPDGILTLSGHLLGGYFPQHVDANTDRQKAAIDRLLEHVQHDCPEFWDRHGPERICSFAEKQRNPDA